MPLKQQRINAFIALGQFLKHFRNKELPPNQQKFGNDLELLIERCYSYNGWFTRGHIEKALASIEHLLQEEGLNNFARDCKEPETVKTVAVIMAGNIPAVGFHDLLCVLLSGHHILIKVSADDHALIPFLCGMLIYFEPELAPAIHFSENRLSNFDAVIATGSNNTSRYFDYYFGKYPHIIRKNRNSVAVLSGKETKEDLAKLGADIFDYFGLGCRNVSKLLVPEGYNFSPLFESVFNYKWVIDNKKYANNYEYNRAIYLLDSVQFLDNNFLMIKKDKSLASPVAVLFYEEYSTPEEALKYLQQHQEQIQCIVSETPLEGFNSVSMGATQSPAINDFADNVNTLQFLMSI